MSQNQFPQIKSFFQRFTSFFDLLPKKLCLNVCLIYVLFRNDFDVQNNEIDGVLDSSEFSDEVNKICEEIEQKWEELKQ